MIIAFEGIDACGKSTQIERLKDYMTNRWRGRGGPVHVFSFPDYETETGKKIRELLRAPERDPLVLQSLMTMNRYERQTEIKEAAEEGHAIFDRYWFSGLVYGLADGLSAKWLMGVHSRLIQPDHWIILDIPVTESFRRRPVREDVYEASEERLEKARGWYVNQTPQRGVSVINAAQDEDLVYYDILQEIGL
jgi:dTMP kinase